MGESNSKEDKDFDEKLRQMQQNQQRQNSQNMVRSQIYQQASVQPSPLVQPQYVEGYVSNLKVLPKMESKSTYAVTANGTIMNNSLKLVQDPNYSSVFYLTFVFQADCENIVTIHYLAQERLGQNQMILGFNNDNRTQSKSAKFPPTQKDKPQAFPNGISFIDTSKFQQQELVSSQNGKIPIIIHFVKFWF